MKRIYGLTILCTLILVLLVHGTVILKKQAENGKEHITVGFLYVGDNCNTYTNNFIRAQKAIEMEFGDSVECIAKYNVAEGNEEEYLQQLVDEGCNLIFSTSYSFGEATKAIAEAHPEIEFCMATCSNANEDPVLPNYHNFMGEIYEGRYISGVVAGMKLQEMIAQGIITSEQAKIGYIGAFPYAEVISGYTAFFLGVRSIVPEATMEVKYTNSWGDYNLEKEVTYEFIEDGCVIISQHSDTMGPAMVCEEMSKEVPVYHVGYNHTMVDVAPTTSLISSRINWQCYMLEATEAVLRGKKIEQYVDGNVHGNDMSGGFKEGWVEMLKLNETIAADGTQEKIDELENDFKKHRIQVFEGDYIGVDPFDKNDIYDLSFGYIENENSSAPTFHYILQDVITIKE